MPMTLTKEVGQMSFTHNPTFGHFYNIYITAYRYTKVAVCGKSKAKKLVLAITNSIGHFL